MSARQSITKSSLTAALSGAAALADNPFQQSDNTGASIYATVESVQSDAFMLGYGEGSVLVEMDDGEHGVGCD